MTLARRRILPLILVCCVPAIGRTCSAQLPLSSADAPVTAGTAEPHAPAGPAAATTPSTDTQLAALADLPSAPEPNGQAAAQSSSSAQTDSHAESQASGATNSQQPSLSDLGFSQQQTTANPQMQAMLEKRTHMLKVHQTLGLVTAIPMFATLVTGPQAKAKGRNGQPIIEPTTANLDFHVALGGVTTGLYYTTAYYAWFAPKIPGTKPKGAIRVHRDLEWVHGPGMIITPILGILAYNQENAGEKVHGIASYHGAAAYITAIAYGASIISISWPIHWKFWEER